MQEKEWIAYHEAGHFVLAYVLEQRIPSVVTVKPNEKQLGHVTGERNDFDPNSNDAGIESTRAYAIECYAGYAAEVRLDPTCSDQALFAASSDYEKAADAIRAARAAGRKETEETLRAEAARLVEEHWTEIDALAKQLLEHETIDGDAAARIVDMARSALSTEGLEFVRVEE